MNRHQATAVFSGPLAALLAPAPPAVAADYLTVAQAQRAIFPEARAFEPATVQLNDAQRRLLTAGAGPQPPHGRLQAWRLQRAAGARGRFFTPTKSRRPALRHIPRWRRQQPPPPPPGDPDFPP